MLIQHKISERERERQTDRQRQRQRQTDRQRQTERQRQRQRQTDRKRESDSAKKETDCGGRPRQNVNKLKTKNNEALCENLCKLCLTSYEGC